jgi:hypothetical protein
MILRNHVVKEQRLKLRRVILNKVLVDSVVK